jgi:serine/threonine protein kinase
MPDLSEQGLDLLNSLLAYDPSKRLTAREAPRHAYFREKPVPKEPGMMPTFPTRHGAYACVCVDGLRCRGVSERPGQRVGDVAPLVVLPSPQTRWSSGSGSGSGRRGSRSRAPRRDC